MTIYQPTPDTTAARALDYLVERSRMKPAGAWIPNVDVAQHLGVKPNAVRPSLDKAIEVGLVERSLSSDGFTQWRLGVIKPRRKPKSIPDPGRQKFTHDWPPGFVSQFDTVKVASYEERRK